MEVSGSSDDHASRPLELLGCPPERLVEACVAAGFSRHRAWNLFKALHGSGVTDPVTLRGVYRPLRQHAATHWVMAALEPVGEPRAEEGEETRKLLFRTRDGLPVETVLMPRQRGGYTVCVSSQVGCRVGCSFCRTGRMGLVRNLLAGEIVDQVRRARFLVPGELRNVVFMGMGEPLENLDAVLDAVEVLRPSAGYGVAAGRITVSTSGHVPGMRELGRRAPKLNLAVSLNAVDDTLRSALMPINRRYPIAELMRALVEHPRPPSGSGTVMVEYVLLAGVNDLPEHAERLGEMFRELPVKLNLIAYNPVPGLPFERPSPERVAIFKSRLGKLGKGVIERSSWGQGIQAACGQLGAEILEGERRGEPVLPPSLPLPWKPAG